MVISMHSSSVFALDAAQGLLSYTFALIHCFLRIGFVFLYLYTHKLESLKHNVSIYLLLNDIKCERLRAIMKIS